MEKNNSRIIFSEKYILFHDQKNWKNHEDKKYQDNFSTVM